MSRRYINPPGSPERYAGPVDYLSFFARRTLGAYRLPNSPPHHVLSRAEAIDQLAASNGSNSITWLGHAAFYIRLDDIGLLIDPFLSWRAGPGLFGPPRFAGPQIGVSDLPTIDAMLISHNHYDHLDAVTLRAFPSRDSTPIAVPQGLARLVRQFGYRNVKELEWDSAVTIGGVSVHATPAIHWSKRGLRDENASHWCGFMLSSATRRVYFSGDTGYGPVFPTMAERWDRIDLGIVGIGAYEPQSIMKPVHTTPEEAVRIGQDLGCQRLLGMHWGTVVLSDEDPWEPPERFRVAASVAGYRAENVWLMRIGETRPLVF